MTDIYRDGQYLESNPTWHEADAPWKARQIQGILTDNDAKFSTVCEVGCGTGEILVQLSGMFPDATFIGYDISPQAYGLASRRATDRVSFSTKDVLAEPDGYHDLVVMADVVEHVEDPFAFLRGLKELGRLKVLHIPLDISVQSVLRMTAIMNLRRDVGHIHYFTKDTALALLRDCGYQVLDWRYTASRLELPNQSRSSKLIAPLRRAMSRMDKDVAVRVLGGYSLLVLAE